ncbi:MAG: GH92 family glycosyl hydrolase [Clostridia bacterium]|nr:GH92 family glycosyl hydrolase [Clostridia bacterium]
MKRALYTDPMRGTVGDGLIAESHGGGKTYPGACLPGGMIQLSPDTVTGGDNGSGYNYCHSTIEGFSVNHMSGIGWYGDLGNLQIMPVTGETDLRSGSNEEVPFIKGTQGWKSAFSHESESARAGYYSVLLERYGILAESTVSAHTGKLRFTYPDGADARVIFNFSRRIGGRADYETIRIINNSRIEGSIHCTPAGGGFGRGNGKIEYDLHFVCEFSRPAEKLRFFANEEFAQDGIDFFEHEDAALLAHFGSNCTEPLVVSIGISYIDLDGVRNNFEKECSGISFDEMAQNSLDVWEETLGCIKVSGSNETDLKLFYTCLYHTLLDPRASADADGRYTLAGKIFKDTNYTHRTVFSGWDVYRSEFPLLSLIRPDIYNDEINSLLSIAIERKASFSRWELLGINANCMVGDPGQIVVADAYVKGIRNFDAEKAFDIAMASAQSVDTHNGEPFHSARPSCVQYKNDVYVPEKLSDTLEFLLADYAAARFAKAMGKNAEHDWLMSRAMRYAENFNPELGFLAPRYADGSFVFEENEYDDDGCVESNIFQQAWFVPYDVIGLSELYGKERTLELLERFFEKADLGALWNDDYNHSNEPCHNITHYFSMLGKPGRTQYWTRRVQKESYRTGAYGFCGNEDVGQLSAWYVLSAIGFAQLCPGHEAYLINTPLFKEAEVRLDPRYHSCTQGETLNVLCDKDPLDYPYIKSVKFNGKPVTKIYLNYSEIVQGGKLEFELCAEPCEPFATEIPDFFE